MYKAPSLLVIASCFAASMACAAEAPHELSAVIKGLMPESAGAPIAYTDLKKYGYDFHFASSEETAKIPAMFRGGKEPYFKIYVGKMQLKVNGKQFLAPSMEDNPAWQVSIAGSNAGPNVVFIQGDQVNYKLRSGPTYFRKAGLKLEPLGCDYMNAGNYDGFFKVTAPGKQAVILGISASSGSAGQWYSYSVFWNDFSPSYLPEGSRIGECAIKD